jgi:hypothetical protein
VSLDVGLVAHISADRDRAPRSELRHQRAGSGLVEVSDDDVVTVRGEPANDLSPHP